jgi:hypothetical protein
LAGQPTEIPVIERPDLDKESVAALVVRKDHGSIVKPVGRGGDIDGDEVLVQPANGSRP